MLEPLVGDGFALYAAGRGRCLQRPDGDLGYTGSRGGSHGAADEGSLRYGPRGWGQPALFLRCQDWAFPGSSFGGGLSLSREERHGLSSSRGSMNSKGGSAAGEVILLGLGFCDGVLFKCHQASRPPARAATDKPRAQVTGDQDHGSRPRLASGSRSPMALTTAAAGCELGGRSPTTSGPAGRHHWPRSEPSSRTCR